MARALPLLLALQLSGCVRWVAEPNPRAALQGRGHREVRVVATDGRTLLLRDPQVSRDSLFGWSHLPGPRMGGRMALPLANVARVERRVADRRPLAVAAILAVAGLTIAAKP